MFLIGFWEDKKTCKSCDVHDKEIQSASGDFAVIGHEVVYLQGFRPTGVVNIRSICCNHESVLALTNEGLVLGWGESSSGLLGETNATISNPSQIERLTNISQIAIGKSHAAAIDKNGALFTWGRSDLGKLGYLKDYLQTTPEFVRSSKEFKSSQVICGEDFTGILSDGGYVHIYGEIGCPHFDKFAENASVNTMSFSHPELNNHSVVQLTGGKRFISALVDTGEVYILDRCMDLVRLPCVSADPVFSIVANFSTVWGIGKDYITEWKALENIEGVIGCQLSTWTGNYFEVSPGTKAWSVGENFLTVNEGTSYTSKWIQEILPYKRSEYATKLIEYALESPRLSLKKQTRVALQNGEHLERLFSREKSHKTIEKIMQCRIEHSNRQFLESAFSETFYENVKFSFTKIKEYSWAIKIYRSTIAVATLTSVVSLTLKKAMNRNKDYFFAIAKNSDKNSVKSDEKKQKLKSMFRALKKQYHLCMYDIYLTLTQLNKQYNRIQLQEKIGNKFLKMVIELWKIRTNPSHFSKEIALVLKEAFQKSLELESKKILNGSAESINNEVLHSFHRKCIVESFLKTVSKIVLRKTNIIKAESIKAIQRFCQRNPRTRGLEKLIRIICSKLVFVSFTQIVTTSGYIQFVSILKKIVYDKVKPLFHEIFSEENQKLQKLVLFSILLVRILALCQIKDKISSWKALKHNQSQNADYPLCRYTEYSSDISSPFHTNQNTLIDPALLYSIDTTQHKSSISSRNIVSQSHQFYFGTSSIAPEKRPKVNLIKRLISKNVNRSQKLRIIKNNHSVKSDFRMKKNALEKMISLKKINEKPPWRPAVSPSNFVFNETKDSALKKGFEYYTKIKTKAEKQKNSESSDSHNFSNYSPSILSPKSYRSPKNYLEVSSSMNLQQSAINISLAVLVINRTTIKINKRFIMSSFADIKKKPSKLPAPTPDDSPNFIYSQNVISLIKSSWHLGVILIASEKLNRIMRVYAGKLLFNRL